MPSCVPTEASQPTGQYIYSLEGGQRDCVRQQPVLQGSLSPRRRLRPGRRTSARRRRSQPD